MANLGSDEAPGTWGHHRAQIAARRRASGTKQSEKGEHRPRVAAGRGEEGEGVQISEVLQEERKAATGISGSVHRAFGLRCF